MIGFFNTLLNRFNMLLLCGSAFQKIEVPVSVVTDELCEIHFLDPVPKYTCSICTRSSKSVNNKLEPERVIIPISRANYPKKIMFFWYPFNDSVTSIPQDCDAVHIVGSFSTSHFDQLCEHLSELVLVEIVPSVAHLVEDNLVWFSQFHVGIVARRRYRQS